MLTAIVAWLSSKGVSLLLGFAANLIMDAWKSYQNNQAQQAAGRHEVEAAQAADGARVEGEIAVVAAKPVSEADAINELEGGKA